MFTDQYLIVSHLRQLANELNAQYTEGSVRMLSHDTQFEINIYPPSALVKQMVMMNIPARFEIKATVKAYHHFMVTKNDVIDWIAEHIFLHHDFQTGDEPFDNSFFITVDDPAWARRYFAQHTVRSTISDIMSGGSYRVYCASRELKVDKFVKTFDDCPSSAGIVNIIDKLSPLISIQSSLEL